MQTIIWKNVTLSKKLTAQFKKELKNSMHGYCDGNPNCIKPK